MQVEAVSEEIRIKGKTSKQHKTPSRATVLSGAVHEERYGFHANETRNLFLYCIYPANIMYQSRDYKSRKARSGFSDIL